MADLKTLYDYTVIEGRPVAAFDADGTLFSGYCIFPLFDYFAKHGFVDQDSNADYQRLADRHANGGIDYPTFVLESLVQTAQMLEDRSTREADELATQYFGSVSNWFPFVKPTINAYKEANVATVLVTAEPSFIGRAIATVLELDVSISSQFETMGGEFDSGDIREVLTSNLKGAYLEQIEAAGCTITAAYGDSVGDIGMLNRAQHAYCIDPSAELEEIASKNGWGVLANTADQHHPLVPSSL